MWYSIVRKEKGLNKMGIILSIIFFIFAGICWKSYKETGEDNCQFGTVIFVLVGILCIYLQIFPKL